MKRFQLSGSISILTGDVGAFRIITPATGHSIKLESVSVSVDKASVSVSLLENYTFADVGATALVPLNKNRALTSSAATLVVEAMADVTAAAVPATTQATLSVTAFPAVSNLTQITEGWTLKPNTIYLLAISNANAATAAIGYNLSWTE